MEFIKIYGLRDMKKQSDSDLSLYPKIISKGFLFKEPSVLYCKPLTIIKQYDIIKM